MSTDPLDEAVSATIRDHPEAVRRWLANEPGSWGFLAGKAVLDYRRRLGRTLTEAERRAVWSLLWGRLTALRGVHPSSRLLRPPACRSPRNDNSYAYFRDRTLALRRPGTSGRPRRVSLHAKL